MREFNWNVIDERFNPKRAKEQQAREMEARAARRLNAHVVAGPDDHCTIHNQSFRDCDCPCCEWCNSVGCQACGYTGRPLVRELFVCQAPAGGCGFSDQGVAEGDDPGALHPGRGVVRVRVRHDSC